MPQQAREPSHNTPQLVPLSEVPVRPRSYFYFKARVGLIITLLGFVLLILGARPGFFGMDRSPVIGFVQLAVMIVGLAVMCVGGYISMMALWQEHTTSIAADIGLRLVSTGYVIVVFAGMADVFGLGSHPLPAVPYFGILQARGVMIGQALMAIGFIMMVPFSRPPLEKKKTE